MDKIQILQNKLNRFVNKYYANQIIKGLIVIPTIFFVVVFLVSFLEYINWFPINTRLFLLLFSVATILFFVVAFLFIPLLKFLKIGKRLSDRKAAKIIAQHFPDIQDKIINALQLHSDFDDDNDLIIAGLNQKIEQLEKFDFNDAVNFKSNLKILVYLLIALCVFGLSLFIKPEIYTKGTKRIISLNTEFVKEAGFQVVIDTNKLLVNRSEDLEIDVKLVGNELPTELFINYGGLDFLLEKVTNTHYKYKFKNVNGNFYFNVYNSEFRSKNYQVKVLLKPILKSFKLHLVYPKYINKAAETIDNINEINVPYGSKLEWQFYTQFCDSLLINKNNNLKAYFVDNNTLKINELALKNTVFSVSLQNKNTTLHSFINIKVNVIPDLYPSIKVSYVTDKTNKRLFYFKGFISDDFGFSKLEVYKNSKPYQALDFLPNMKEQEFYYAYEFSKDSTDATEIFFKVSDNDFIAGTKSAVSDVVRIVMPKPSEIDKKQQEDFKEISEKLDKSLFMAYELKQDIKEIKKSLINDNLQTWEKQKQIDNLVDKHNKLNNLIKEIAQKNLEKDNFKNSFSESTKELLEKQKQIQDLLENVMTDEIKKLMEELKKLSEQYNEDKLNELSQKMELNYDDLSKELDKNLELLKKFEIEERINNQIENLKKLSEKQEKLSKELGNKKANTDSLSAENKKMGEELNRIKDEYNKNKDSNEKLENKFDLQDFQKEFDEIEQGIKENEQDIQNNKKQAKNKAQKNANNLNNLAQKMRQMMDKNKDEEEAENADALRLLLNNLFFISFGQERVMQEFLYIQYDNPKYMKLLQEQKKLSDDFQIARDSLYALSKRTQLIGRHISKSAFTIEDEMINTINYLEKRNISVARRKQQEVLTAVNDMILLLSESLQKMDQSGSGSGKSSSKRKQKPKKGNQESLSDMKKGQESLKNQLQNMLNKMKQGGKQNKSAMGKMLAQQEILQQMLNEMMTNGGVGKETNKLLKDIKKLMEQNKKDLVNMRLSNSTMMRQKQIMTRLLEAENAEKERDKEERRESNQAINYKLSNPEKLFDDKEENINFNEIFKTKSVNLFDFYKYKYIEYLKQIEKNTKKTP